MINQAAIDSAKTHAMAEYPKESCGFVTSQGYHPCENVAQDPTKDFEINSSEINEYLTNNQVLAVIHSHPHEYVTEPSSPSAKDIQSQISMNILWGIIDTDGTFANDPYWLSDDNLDLPLIGVEFQYGVNDCFSLVRRFFHQKRGIRLDDCPRDNYWWDNTEQENLFISNFARLGFQQIDPSLGLLDGDILLLKVASNQINHALIYLSNAEDGVGLVLHHLAKRLSAREPAGIWINKTEMVLRYAL